MSPQFERREFARRDFIAGALATGALSAVATYLAPGGRSPTTTIVFATGEDPTGARDLLISMWNRANPRTKVVVDLLEGSTSGQKPAMEDHCVNGTADVLNLDIIDIPYFHAKDYIAPVALADLSAILPRTLLPSRLGDPKSSEYWAAPFNADVGMLFERHPPDRPLPESAPPVRNVIDDGGADGSRHFAGQLRWSSSTAQEAFVVNVLEHAISRVPDILGPANGMPLLALEKWQEALRPLRAAVVSGRITRCETEEETRDRFRAQPPQPPLPYMRNWPVHYRQLQQDGDRDSQSSRIRVSALPVGMLGGQSLAVVAKSRNADRAGDFIRFLTDEPAQKILASYGLAAMRLAAYDDPSLQAFIPHLNAVKGAVENARPRAVHRNYRQLSDVVARHAKGLLDDGTELSSEFVDQMREALA